MALAIEISSRKKFFFLNGRTIQAPRALSAPGEIDYLSLPVGTLMAW
jgi:hypothetical protein